MADVNQSLSQLLTTFGPGAMMDLPDRAVIVAGLDHWDTGKGAFKVIEEPRLSALLEKALSKNDRWEAGKPVKLFSPPIANDSKRDPNPAGVQVRVFPTWFTCEGVQEAGSKQERRRQMVRWQNLDVQSHRRKFQRDDGKKIDVTPIRFVGACKKGHLQDIDWKWLVHRGEPCAEPMWIEEESSSADPAKIRIGCHCNRPSVSLADAFKPGFLGRCKGHRPWLNSFEDEGCEELLHFLSRSATNTYFSQTVTLISLPIEEDELGQRVLKHWKTLGSVDAAMAVFYLRNVPEIGEALKSYTDDQVYQKIGQIRASVFAEVTQDPKIAEFDLLGCGAENIGADDGKQPLFAGTLPTQDWDCQTKSGLQFIESIVAVHRLKAVTCLYGFTRLEPSPTVVEENLEDIRLAVDGAPLADHADWLPAMERYGEGLFVKINPNAIKAWNATPQVRERNGKLVAGLTKYKAKYGGNQNYPGSSYVLLHSLSHALMEEISLDCGYPMSSLSERIYAFHDKADGGNHRFGILIYTASAGAQGTLGGLTEQATRVPELIANALDRLRLCSNDPVCADHDPTQTGDERALLGAACHACVLVPETSCEARNQFLDRNLLIETVSDIGSEMFR